MAYSQHEQHLLPITYGPKRLPARMLGPVGAPAVILVQEWWGAADIDAHAARLASHGYRVLVPDLYGGKAEGRSVLWAKLVMLFMPTSGSIRAIADAAAHLKAEGAPKVGIVGMCYGAVLALGAAARSDDIACCAPFYGASFLLFDASKFHKPLQAHWGQLDNLKYFSDMAMGERLAREVRASGNTQVEFHVYPTVGHSFMQASPAPFATFEERLAKVGHPVYDKKPIELAWSRLVPFLDTHLKPHEPPERAYGAHDQPAAAAPAAVGVLAAPEHETAKAADAALNDAAAAAPAAVRAVFAAERETAGAADGGLKGAAAAAPAVVSAIAPPADSSAATPTAAGAS
ncbi:hypothetical protein KFE25_008275 [Diacronema lutheri]|uniref:Dienelactone hydrolase domain-containing protein n=1 Tax=Diacronema lutheri TaxID=2081491 RepID=A0A8J6CDA0_DIALT|nr:hypothetical protein KFE25_008275 [Diacronema lutheri]